eukprot:scaffold1776_cov329-Alexandrium_tamarense.AAC.1
MKDPIEDDESEQAGIFVPAVCPPPPNFNQNITTAPHALLSGTFSITYLCERDELKRNKPMKEK